MAFEGEIQAEREKHRSEAAEKEAALLRATTREEEARNRGVWEWQNEHHVWTPYPTKLNLIIEKAHSAQQSEVVVEASNGQSCCISFGDMKEVSVEHSTQRAVHRVEKPCFELPWWWEHARSLYGHTMVRLGKDAEAYQWVDSKFQAGGVSGAQIISVEQVQNATLWDAHKLAEQRMGSLPDKVNEHWGFHGCEANTVDSIVAGGLDWRWCGKNATVHGEGSYVALRSSYSNQDKYSKRDASGHKRMFFVRTIVGKVVLGGHGMRVAPDSAGGHHVAVDNKAYPTMFITFDQYQTYPGFLITYK